MSSSLPFGFTLILLLALSAFFHRFLYRWALRTWPLLAAHRKRVAGVLVCLYGLPLARPLAHVFPNTVTLPVLSGSGSLWHLTVALGMLPVLLLRAARRAKQAGSAPLAEQGSAPLAEHDSASLSAHDPGALSEQNGERHSTPSKPMSSIARRGELNSSRRSLLEGALGAASLATVGGTLAWGALRGRYEWTVEQVPVRLARLPRVLDGFTIVQLSDLHVGSFMQEGQLQAAVDRVRMLHPDLVVVTGDIIDFDSRTVPLAARMIAEMRGKYGVKCIAGNHDYYAGIHPLLQGFERAGVDVLHNRSEIIAPGEGGGFSLLGVADLAAAHSDPRNPPDLVAAYRTAKPDSATVLLAHQPRFVDQYHGHRIDLQLSGHTHAGQINPGFSPAKLFMKYFAGHYQVGDTQLYVNRGFGTAGPPSRVGSPPEITQIVLVAG